MRLVAVVSHGHQSEEYQEGLQYPGSSIKALHSIGSFFSSWSVGRGLKGPVELGESTNSYMTGARARG